MTAKKLINRTIIYALLILMAAIFLIPVYMTTVTALKTRDETTLATAWNPPDLPLNFSKFQEAFEYFGPSLGNSFALVGTATILSALLGSINGYVLAKWRIPGERFLFPLMLFGMFLPYQAILIPLFEFMSDLGLYGGIPGLVLIHVV
ncbi:MAG: ABC transporter permease, partial [Phototrophicales bacterium]